MCVACLADGEKALVEVHSKSAEHYQNNEYRVKQY